MTARNLGMRQTWTKRGEGRRERGRGEDPWESLKQEHDECTARSF